MKQIKKAGIYELSNEQYHQQEGLNKSGLVQLSRSPAHYLEWYDSPDEEPTRAMAFGTALHTAVLEPKNYDSSIIIAPQIDKRTKDGKVQWAAFEMHAKGKIILTQEEKDTVQGMKKSVYKNSTAYDLLIDGKPEQSVFFKDPVHKFLCKVRPDWVTQYREVVDIKTCVDASYDGFSKAIANLKYHWQAYFYLKGLTLVTGTEHKKFMFIAIEKDPPYALAVYEASQEMLNTAKNQIEPLLEVYGKCLKTKKWPGYEDKLRHIQLPRWAS